MVMEGGGDLMDGQKSDSYSQIFLLFSKEADAQTQIEVRQFFEARQLEGDQTAADEWRAHRLSVETDYGYQLESINARLEDRINQLQVWLLKCLLYSTDANFIPGIFFL